MNYSECLEQIAESIRLKRLSLWVGAGISCDTLPLGNELKFYILEMICSKTHLQRFYENRLHNEKDIGMKIKEYPLEAFIECISKNDEEIVSVIAELFRGGSPNKGHELIARLMKEGFVKDVLTTNFDLLIEKALERIGEKKKEHFNVWHTEDQFTTVDSDLSFPTIFKIHGSADDDSSIRVTLGDVASQTLSDKRIRVLDHFLGSRKGDVLVLGYGAGDNFDVNPALSKISPKKRIFYVNHSPRQRKIARLPKAFLGYEGCSICCDTDKVVKYLWRAIFIKHTRESYDKKKKQIAHKTFPRKDWRVVIDRWVDQTDLPYRVFILAFILQQLRWLDEAYRLYKWAEEAFRKLRAQKGIAAALGQLGMIEQHRGKYDQAKRMYRVIHNRCFYV
jgi:hypothetical protein